jgi:hypothetical protein
MALGGAVVGTIRRAGALGALVLLVAACGGSGTTITGVSDAVASLTITVEQEGGVPTAEQSIEMNVGDSVELFATATNALGLAVSNVSATWSSSAPAVQVGSDGVAKALAPGAADIYATIGDVVATMRVVVSQTTTVPPPTS